MKRKKFQQRIKELVGTKELKEAGFDAPLFLRRGLLVFAGLTLILGIVFIAAPSYWGFWRKGNSGADNDAKKSLTYSLKNETASEWKDVVLTFEGATSIEDSDTAKVFEVLSVKGITTHKLHVGSVKAGETKDVTIFILNEVPGTYTYTSTFRDSSGVIVRLREDRALEF